MDREDLLALFLMAQKEKLEKLDLSNRDITEIPSEIGDLTFLKELNLSYNNIKSLPAEISKLVNLEVLLLLRNDLELLPPQIGKLQNLKMLDVSHNQLKAVPEEISQLANLQTFDASYCKIATLPVTFINLLSLKELYLEYNAFIFPPEKVVKRGLYATMHFLTEEKRKQEAAKVLVQVFSMPHELQIAFRQYLQYFHDVIAKANDHPIQLDINFINQSPVSETHPEMETYLHDFMNFVKSTITTFEPTVKVSPVERAYDLQSEELRKQISHFNETLNAKVSEIQAIQSHIKTLTAIIDGKK